jgi:hypothetical protein
MKLSLIVLTATAVLAGCATPYKAPQGGETATLIIQAPADEMFGLGQNMSLVSGEQCTNPQVLAGFHPLSSERLVRQAVPAGSRIYIKASLSNFTRLPADALLHQPRELLCRWLGASYTLKQLFVGESCLMQLVLANRPEPPPSLLATPGQALAFEAAVLSTLSHAFRYLEPSTLSAGPAPRLSLATSTRSNEHPHFFEGRVLRPQLFAQLLTAVHLIVGSRFFTPANSVARAVMLADPIVTAGGAWLRFEGFSSCGSTYVRADLLPEGYEGDLIGKGTTNVDFNAPMRAALARVRDEAGLALAVGHDRLRLQSGAAQVTERQVALPTRWLRALVEVQACQAAMRQRFALGSIEACASCAACPRPPPRARRCGWRLVPPACTRPRGRCKAVCASPTPRGCACCRACCRWRNR